MSPTDRAPGHGRQTRPGGRSARVRAAVLDATIELLSERGFKAVAVPEIAARAGVHPATIYRRWRSTGPLVGEAILERARPLSPTPDTGSLRGDLVQLLMEGFALLRSAPVRALFVVLLDAQGDPPNEIARARDRFWHAHITELTHVVNRATARAELPAAMDPAVLAELVIGPALIRSLFEGRDLEPADADRIVERAVSALVFTRNRSSRFGRRTSQAAAREPGDDIRAR